MYLLNSRAIQLELLRYQHLPPYAIVSHRWGAESEEVLFADICDRTHTQSKGKCYKKVLRSCAQAVQDGINYVWLDTCCVDKGNSTELTEVINSMYKWYRQSVVCYAYLHDVSDPSRFTESDWFTRGWTLQELIAPKVLKFFTKDWLLIGAREELIDPIVKRTGISPEILRSGKIPQEVTISQKMFWAAKRETARVEDRAYSLLGILGVSMLPFYGIDDVAFEDLQHKLIAKYPDQTLFAWYHIVIQQGDVQMADAGPPSDPDPDPESVDGNTSSPSKLMNTTGLLASSPSQYLKSYEISEPDFRKNYVDGIRDHNYRSHFSISNNLVHISLPVKHIKEKIWKAVLRCSFEPPNGDQIQHPLVIYLEEIQPWKYLRVHFTPNKEDWKVEDQMNGVHGVPGSLERLRDEELHLEGYLLRDIDVVGRHGQSPSDDQPVLSDLPVNLRAFTRRKQRGEKTGPEEAIVLGREALDLYPPGRPNRLIPAEEEDDRGKSGNEVQHWTKKAGNVKAESQKVIAPMKKCLESEMSVLMDIRSNFAPDLTGYVTKSSNFPLASGSYGDIYRGKLSLSEKSADVAIKTYTVYLQHDDHLPEKMKRFRREIKVWVRLEHQNILPLFGTIRDPNMNPDIPAMVCPWVENGSLSTYLERNEDLTEAKRFVLVNGVAHGLQYLHSQHVVHGDLSGSNVLVHADGRACIADFGLSTLLSQIGGSTFATSRHNKGTTRWMAPELLDLDDSQTAPTMQCDVYSFGSIMLQIVTGNIPYHYFARDAQIIRAIAAGVKPKRPDQTVVTDSRWAFIEWCWSPVDAAISRPSSDQIVEFTEKELARVMAGEV